MSITRTTRLSITRTTRTRRSAARAALLAALAATTACATTRTTTVESGGDVGAGVIPVDAATLPAGVVIDARLDQALGTSQSKVGDTFTATVASAVAAQNGAVVVPAGAKITGRVTALEGSRNATEPAVIRLDFTQLAFEGRGYPFNAAVTRAVPQTTGADTRGETLQKAGIGAAAGAALGAILSGGDLGKMAIGAVLGAAAGTAISLGVGNVDSTLPAGTTMTLRTTQSVALR
jgi:hypothetical protein